MEPFRRKEKKIIPASTFFLLFILNTTTWKRRKISHRKFISIFIVFRNPRIKSFLSFFCLYHLQQGRMRDKLKVMPFPAGAMHYRMGWNGRRGGIHKVLLSTFFFFYWKKDQNKRFEGGRWGQRGVEEGGGVWGCDSMSASEEGKKVTCWWGGRKWYGGFSSLKKVFEWNRTKQTNEWSQPRMRLDLPPGGFLRPPAMASPPPDGAEGCGASCCCSCCCSLGSTSLGQSTDAAKRGFNKS